MPKNTRPSGIDQVIEQLREIERSRAKPVVVEIRVVGDSPRGGIPEAGAAFQREFLMHLHNYFPELKQRLHAAGITAAALAAEANMAQTQLSRYFSGKVDARVSTLDALEEAFERLTNPEKSPRK